MLTTIIFKTHHNPHTLKKLFKKTNLNEEVIVNKIKLFLIRKNTLDVETLVLTNRL